MLRYHVGFLINIGHNMLDYRQLTKLEVCELAAKSIRPSWLVCPGLAEMIQGDPEYPQPVVSAT